MLDVAIIDEQNYLSDEEQQLIEKLAQFIAKEEQILDEAEISFSIVSLEEIHHINKTYRGVDRPTDVISFALEEVSEDELEIKGLSDEPRILGDIIISYDKVKSQAKDYGHSVKRELGFLVVHGFLHLLGYDHMTDEDEKIMFSQQEKILTEFGLIR